MRNKSHITQKKYHGERLSLKPQLCIIILAEILFKLQKESTLKLSRSLYNQTIQLTDWIDIVYVLLKPSKPPISLPNFSWGPMMSHVWIGLITLTITSDQTVQSSRNNIPSACKEYSPRNILATDTTLVGNNTERGVNQYYQVKYFLFQIQIIYATSVN